MFSDTTLNLPFELVDWEAFTPIYPNGSDGRGYLYCTWCSHFIRLVSRTKTDVRCSDCGQTLAVEGNLGSGK